MRQEHQEKKHRREDKRSKYKDNQRREKHAEKGFSTPCQKGGAQNIMVEITFAIQNKIDCKRLRVSKNTIMEGGLEKCICRPI